jgi:hypothetical protein
MLVEAYHDSRYRNYQTGIADYYYELKDELSSIKITLKSLNTRRQLAVKENNRINDAMSDLARNFAR